VLKYLPETPTTSAKSTTEISKNRKSLHIRSFKDELVRKVAETGKGEVTVQYL